MIAWLIIKREKIYKFWRKEADSFYEEHSLGVVIHEEKDPQWGGERIWCAKVLGRLWTDDGLCSLVLKPELDRHNPNPIGPGVFHTAPTYEMLWASGWRPVAPGTKEEPVKIPGGWIVESEEVQRERLRKKEEARKIAEEETRKREASWAIRDGVIWGGGRYDPNYDPYD